MNIAIRNLRHRKMRTALTVSGIVVGVAMILVLLSLAAGTSTQTSGLLRNVIGSEITVVNSTNPTFVTTTRSGFPGGGFGGGGGGFGGLFGRGNPINESLVSSVENVSGVFVASPQLSTSGYVDGVNVLLYGIDPGSYTQATSGGLTLTQGSDLSSNNQIVLSSVTATNLGVTVGSQVTVGANSTGGTKYAVVGIYSSGTTFGFQARSEYIELSDAQNISGQEGLVTEILVKANDPSLVNQVASDIDSISGVTANIANAVAGSAATLTNTMTTFFIVIGLVALLAGAFGVINTMMMSIGERTREIGTLRAIGATKGQVMKMFLSEALLIGLIGAIAGVFIGVVVSVALPSLTGAAASSGARGFAGIIPGNQGKLLTTLTAFNLVLSFALGSLVGIAAGVYPALRASRMDPVEALRHV
jgi:ABC-type lipoprotein release transport system permease subunit